MEFFLGGKLMSVEEEFLNYTSSYQEEWCRQKVEHTFRVVDFAQRIGESLALSEYDLHLVYLASLLHDIGRFEQIRNDHSFSDFQNRSHGEIGREVLLKDSFIDCFCKTEEEKRMVLEVVEYHGTFEVPSNLEQKDQQIVFIVRDADQLDILESILQGRFSIDIQDCSITESVQKEFFEHHLIHRERGKNPLDEYVAYLAFPYDFHFSYSLEYLKSHHMIENIVLEYISKNSNPVVCDCLRKMGQEMNQYVYRKRGNRYVR